MKAKWLSALFIGFFLSQAGLANQVTKPNFDPVKFISRTPSEVIVIQNGSGNHQMRVLINVSNARGSAAANVYVKNCGTVTRIFAGSSAVCLLEAGKQISWNTDLGSADVYADGSYQVEWIS